MVSKLKSLIPVSKWVVVVGAVLYGLQGAMGMDVAGSILGGLSPLTMLFYWVVLLSGVWALYNKITKPAKKK